MTDVTYPISRRRPLDPPGEATALARRAPIHRMTFADGHRGWLVTGHAAARALLADPRFSNRPEHMHLPVPGRMQLLDRQKDPRFALPPGFFIRMDPPEHTRFRKLLTGQFTVRRMKRLQPRIEEITRGFLDAMQAAGPPADLVEKFALPLPSMVICELLGVPYADRGRFQDDSRELLSLEISADEMFAAMHRVLSFMGELVRRKRVEPGDDLLSGLVETGELKDDELTGVAMLLLIAGHETTANMLGLGTYALLTHPDQLAVLRDDPAAVNGAVEELLRYLSIVHIGPIRTALEDVQIDGRMIRAGESVAVCVPVVNRDPSQFPDPDRLDLTRDATGHMAFGHGVHQCLGQQLARAEMRIGYPALLRRFPTLRLAVPPEEVPMRSDMTIYGVHRLPVTW
ncbi:cytochrome P450 [Actinomadura sp. NBRC 104425]|uniref:cytochrome P450 n=1 Tax=Actinomadura sp. NBRC 104425 TaxID=3032204 RepID=UPI00249FC146|nr:cytochrome P450 [Actinomadura sp. NBRC 104425]GLZ13629.1 cytochrome P450 [Actinomadura sp. NBRC 104425]